MPRRITIEQSLGFAGPLSEARARRLRSVILGTWMMKATEGLNSTRRAYMRGATASLEKSASGYTIRLELVGMIPTLVEFGAGPYDMTEALLSGRSSRRSVRGHRYAVIPFMHNVKGLKAVGLYQQARQLAAGEALPRDLGPGKQNFGGLRRYTNRGGQGRYMTFRTISEAVRPWIRGEIKARNFMALTLRDMPKILQRVLR